MPYDPLFSLAVAVVLAHEGGLVDDPNDPGGITNFGISLAAHPKLGADGIRNLTQDQAKAIYFTDYWLPHRWKDLPQPIAIKAFDCSVPMGATSAIICLQRACRAAGRAVTEDGILGDETVNASIYLPTPVLLAALKSEIAAHFRLVAETRPASVAFLPGWLNRAYG